MIVNDIDEAGLASQPATDENEHLVRAIACGDAAAEQLMAERFFRPVRALLVSRSHDRELAADLTQDVLIEAICALRRGQLRDPLKLPAFVSGIARNKLNNHYRSFQKTEDLELVGERPDLSLGPELAEAQQREDRAARAIESLDPIDRSILQMTLIEGLKPGIIAERLGLNPDLVRQRKLRATRRVIELVRVQSQTGSPCHSTAGRRL